MQLYDFSIAMGIVIRSLVTVGVLFGVASAQFFSDRSASSGAHVSAPVFVNYNLTWQFTLSMSVEPGTIAFPLFVNRSGNAGNFPLDCQGMVTVCCLHMIPDYFMNRELRAYVRHLGECDEEMASKPTVQVLEEMPALLSTALFAFDPKRTDVYPRAWSLEQVDSNDAHVAYEVLQENLKELWFTKEEDGTLVPGPEGLDVVDRSLFITFLFVKPTVLPVVQLVLAEQKVLFHDASRDFDENAEQEHDSFLINCQEQFKPEHALWRADTLEVDHVSFTDIIDNGTIVNKTVDLQECVWFCRAGYYRYPSTTDWYYEDGPGRDGGHCVKQPDYTVGVEVAFRVYIRTEVVTVLVDSDREKEGVYADIFLGIQKNLTRAGLAAFPKTDETWGMIYVPGEDAAYPGPEVDESDTTVRPASLAVFTGKWEPEEDEQRDVVVKAMKDEMQRWWGGVYDPRVMQITFVDARSFIRVPPVDYSVPPWLWLLAAVWAACVVVGCCFTVYLVIKHMRRQGSMHYNQRMRETAAMMLKPAFGGSARKVAELNTRIEQAKVFHTAT